MNSLSRIFLATLVLCLPATAQTKVANNSSLSGDFSTRPNGGFRLQANAQGAARVQLPELDVSARALELDRPAGTITQVRATGSVNFKLNLKPRGGGTPARIEATCDNATLTTPDRRLVLRGNVKGFYQVVGGARNTLGGSEAAIYYQGENLVADLTGGVTLRVPTETLGRPDAIGDVTITAQRAQINQGNGSANFAGNARAVSSGGPNAFDVAAPRFILTRGADGAIATLKTVGRTLVKLDLPPDPPPAGTSATSDSIGKPTRVEVAADGATIERATSTATFEGNVKGFYRLIQNGEPQNFDFAGTRAVVRYVPTVSQNALAGLNLQVSGATVEGPAFNLGF